MTSHKRYFPLVLIALLGGGLCETAYGQPDGYKKVSSEESYAIQPNAENAIPSSEEVEGYIEYFSSPSPWLEIRKKRISTLLPDAMAAANLNHWLIVCRESNNDPLANHVGCENAGGTAVVLFSKDSESDEVTSRIFSPLSESTALKELGTFDFVIDVDKSESAIEAASSYLTVQNTKGQIGVNSFTVNPLADGLSHSQYIALKDAFAGTDISLKSAEDAIYYWLARKLPEEVEIMAKAAAITSRWEYEAYQSVIPGKTTDLDIARFLKNKMSDAGVSDGWAPSQNPAVNSGPDRGHSHPTNRVIQRGDVIQIDFGIRVFKQWVTDIQRFAYVLQEGEAQPPEQLQHAWKSAIHGRNAAFNAMTPGATGNTVHTAQQKVMQQSGSLPVMWSTGHPVGYVAHDVGPNLGVRPASDKLLDRHMTFAFDGFFSWYYSEHNVDASTVLHEGKNQTTKTISVEDMVVIEEDGARFLTPPQTSLILIH
ncbi:MAG: M24 family metallopeptidase [Alteromonas sp.]|jgi:Xaa-Pro aminopeptidase|uniref:M24 family metallopeptidase n=1 Tax=Alteromonas sp. TaxID=232 RepID=UPI0032D96766